MEAIKENRKFWLYIVGIVLLFIILLVLANTFIVGNSKTLKSSTPTSGIPLIYTKVPDYRLDSNSRYYADFVTSMGNFRVELFPLSSPANVNGFIFLAQRGYYTGTSLYRVVPNVLIQGGSRLTLNDDPTDDSLGNPGFVVQDEINWDSLNLSDTKRKKLEADGFSSNVHVSSIAPHKYSVVMANAGVTNTAGSQFFIVFADNADPRLTYLSGRHTVIGDVVDGRDVIDKMRKVDVDMTDINNPRPVVDIIVNSITIVIEK